MPYLTPSLSTPPGPEWLFHFLWGMEDCSKHFIVSVCCSFLLILVPCSSMAPPWAEVLQKASVPAWTFYGLQWIPAPSPGAPPVSASLTLEFPLLFLTLPVFPCSSWPLTFLFFINYIFTESSLTWMMDSAVSCCGVRYNLLCLPEGQTLASPHCQNLVI